MKTLRLARVHPGALAMLAVLTLSACLLIAGMPRMMQGAFNRAMAQYLDAAPAQQADLTALATSNGIRQDIDSVERFKLWDAEVRKLLPAGLRPVVRPPAAGTSHMSAKTSRTPVHDTGGMRYINLAWLSDADRRVQWIEGRAPGKPSTKRFENTDIPLFEVGVVAEAATKMGLTIGTEQIIGESDYAAIKVVGIFKALNPADRWWSHNADALNVNEVQPPGKLDLEKSITALIPPAALTVLSGQARQLDYRWVLSVDTAALGSLDPVEVQAAIKDYDKALALNAKGDFAHRLDTQLANLIAAFLTKLATAQTIMYLALGGLLMVALGVIVLGVQLVLDRIDQALGLMRARGAALRQIIATAGGLTAAALLPAVLAGCSLAHLVPGPAVALVHIGPALLLLTGIGYACARAALEHRAPLNERRGDVATAKPSAKRITLEVLVIGLALVGAYLIRTRGLTTDVATQGQDPFLLFVPIALTLAAALITLRCYPYPLRLIVRLAARARPAVPFLGLTRAARARSFSVLPVLILLPALAVSVFASLISSGIVRTQEVAVWQKAGAPIRVEYAGIFTDEAIAQIGRTPGVDQVVPAQLGKVQIGFTAERADILAVDLAAWSKLIADAPITLPAQPGGDGIPALVSPAMKGRGTIDVGWQNRMKVREAGVIEKVPGFFSQGRFLVVPLDANQRAGTRVNVNTLLISGSADPAQVRAEAVKAVSAAVKGGDSAKLITVAGAAEARAAITGDALTGTVLAILRIVTVALAAYALVAVVVTLVISAAERAAALSFLRTLGLSARQAQGLTVLEISPMIVLTSLAGLALGLVLPAALGPGVDLSAYTGDLGVQSYDLDLLTPTLLAAGLTGVAVVGAYAHTAISRRRSLGSVLRVGE
ncbi:hypothetical protein [Nonomuraea endophytica]|uniref:Putative ABC transport system permease protein n=1 Tax=Nonomuraea endophytica TaxID=714136 RepID=A0A7W8A623_9ACTN|nr:hypothetical protein [Nonomuraea endophytica]MBB5080282.1 putative ABC transport system permease protein [Nonomuraea endophytica]